MIGYLAEELLANGKRQEAKGVSLRYDIDKYLKAETKSELENVIYNKAKDVGLK